MLDWLDPQLRAAHLSPCVGATTNPHQKKGTSITIAGPAPARFTEPALVAERWYLCFEKKKKKKNADFL